MESGGEGVHVGDHVGGGRVFGRAEDAAAERDDGAVEEGRHPGRPHEEVGLKYESLNSNLSSRTSVIFFITHEPLNKGGTPAARMKT